MEDIEGVFIAVNEYINYHVDKLFGKSVKHKFMASLNYLFTAHMGRIILGALFTWIGLMIRGHYEKQAYYDFAQMSIVQPTPFFYWVGFVFAFTGLFILALYILIIFYNLVKYLVNG